MDKWKSHALDMKGIGSRKMNFGDWLDEVDELAKERFGGIITSMLPATSWRRYYSDGLTPVDVLRSLNDD